MEYCEYKRLFYDLGEELCQLDFGGFQAAIQEYCAAGVQPVCSCMFVKKIRFRDKFEIKYMK